MKFLPMIFIFTSCAIFKGQGPANEEYFLAKSSPDSLAKIKNNLQKRSTNAGRRFIIDVLPLPPIVQRKMALKLPAHKACFQLEMIIASKEDEIKKDFWQGQVVMGEKKIDLNWQEPSKHTAKLFYLPGAYGPKKHWSQTGVMCSKENLALKDNFELLLTSKDVAFPFSKTMTYSWSISRYVQKDGEVVPEKNTKHIKRRYRGW